MREKSLAAIAPVDIVNGESRMKVSLGFRRSGPSRDGERVLNGSIYDSDTKRCGFGIIVRLLAREAGAVDCQVGGYSIHGHSLGLDQLQRFCCPLRSLYPLIRNWNLKNDPNYQFTGFEEEEFQNICWPNCHRRPDFRSIEEAIPYISDDRNILYKW
jgi:hypothetical protein